MTRRQAVAGLLVAWLLGGCGYHLAGSGESMPKGAETITIRLFKNRTREKGLEVALQRSIEEEFRRRGPLTVQREPDGDLILSGSIRRFGSTPVAFAATDEAVQFQGVLQISFRLTERATKKVIYETKLLQETLDFGAVSGVVVSTSPRFQRGTIDARDLVDLQNAQLIEARRREALGDLLDLLARDVYLQSMEGF